MPDPQFIRALQSPACYRHQTGKIRLFETHISWVLLTGSYAYKIKKPVNFGFLDFTTLEKRRFYCDEEIRLNRRFAPHLYLQTVPISGRPEHPLMDVDEPVFEYAVKMKQFDPAQLFSLLADAGRLTEHEIDLLADTVAEFHRYAPPADRTAAYGSAESVEYEAMQNFSTLREHDTRKDLADSLRPLEQWSRNRFVRNRSLYHRRQQEGFVRECHGDLHLGNIVLIDSTPTVFDCIEFNPSLRFIDVISEIAFLVMDLCYHRQDRAAMRLLNRYLELSGDYSGLRLLNDYLVYRALVRAKIATLSCSTPEGEQNRAGLRTCERYLQTAMSFIRRDRPVLIITHGFSGSGKSTVAAKLADRLPAIRIRSDVERKRTTLQRSRGLYTAATTRFVYNYLALSARPLLENGFSVILDATYLQHALRRHAAAIARSTDAKFVILHTFAPQNRLQQRIQVRAAQQADPSDATPAVLHNQMKTSDPLTDAETADTISVDTSAPFDLAEILGRIGQTRG